MSKKLAFLGIFLLITLALFAQQADVSGNWSVTLFTKNGQMMGTGKASFKQSGDKVTGWVGPSEDDPIPITGVVKGNTLTIKTYPQHGRTSAFDTCEVTLNGDKMVGTMDTDKGKIEFVKSK